MQKIKSRSFVLIIPILIFSGLFFYIFNLIFTTLKFDFSKNKKSRENKYSYVISSSDNKILSKLSRKFEIDNSQRDLHGALVDADLLASVYVELLGGRQPGLSLGADCKTDIPAAVINADSVSSMMQIDRDNKPVRPIRPHAPSAEEQAAHDAFLAKLNDPIWLKT